MRAYQLGLLLVSPMMLAATPRAATRAVQLPFAEHPACLPPTGPESYVPAVLLKCREYLATHPYDSAAYVNLYLSTLDSTRAIRVLESGLQNLPESAVLNENYAYALRRVGNHEAALRTLRKVTDLGGADARIYEEAGRIAARLGSLDQAVEFLREAVRRDRRSSEAWLELASAESRLGNHYLALEAWERASLLTGYREPKNGDSVLASESRRLVGVAPRKPVRGARRWGWALAAATILTGLVLFFGRRRIRNVHRSA